MDERFESTAVPLVRRNRIVLALGASPWLVGVPTLVTFALVTGFYPMLFLLLHLSIFGAIGLMLAYRTNKWPKLIPGRLVADADGVTLDGRSVAAQEQITQALVVPQKGATHVRLKRRGLRPSRWLRVADAKEGRQLLRALGLDATHTAAEMKTRSRVLSWPLWKQLLMITGPMLAGFIPSMVLTDVLRAPLFMMGFIVLVMAWVFGITLMPTTVRIGTDGVLTRWWWSERFIPLSRIKDVYTYEESVGTKRYLGVVIELGGGEHVKLVTGQKGWDDLDGPALVERIQEAIEVHQVGGGVPDPSALARRGRTPLEWVRALRRLGAGANADLRTAPMPIDTLMRVLGDADLPPVARASAAVAALPAATEAERRMIRVAASTAAEPKLRIALERVARDGADEAELAQALAELDSESDAEAARARRS